MKRLLLLLLLILVTLPFVSIAEDILGSKERPVPESHPFSTNFVTLSYSDFEPVSGSVTLSVKGHLPAVKAIDKIYDLSLQRYQGSKYFCFKILVEAKDLSRNVSLPISASNFKAYDDSFLEADILTVLSSIELLDETKAYIYIGFRTPEGMPGYLVFDERVWFNVRFTDIIDD